MWEWSEWSQASIFGMIDVGPTLPHFCSVNPHAFPNLFSFPHPPLPPTPYTCHSGEPLFPFNTLLFHPTCHSPNSNPLDAIIPHPTNHPLTLSQILMLTNNNNNVNVVLFLRCWWLKHMPKQTHTWNNLLCLVKFWHVKTHHTHTLFLCTAGTIYEGRYERFCRRETLIIMFINRGNTQLLQLISFDFFFVPLLLFSLFSHFTIVFFFSPQHNYVYFLYLN